MSEMITLFVIGLTTLAVLVIAYLLGKISVRVEMLSRDLDAMHNKTQSDIKDLWQGLGGMEIEDGECDA